MDPVTATQAFETALTTLKTDAMGMLGVVIPVALAIFGATFGIRKGLQWFRSLSK